MLPDATARRSSDTRRILAHLAASLVLVGLVAAPSQANEKPDPAEVEFFEREVRPILADKCQKCHGAKAQKGGLRLDSRSAIVEGGSTGPAVVPGKPGESLLVDAINYGDTYQMPPKSKLAEKEIASITRWVERGAAWPVEVGPKAATTGESFNLKERARYWSFQPLARSSAPTVRDAAWPLVPADRFILAQLEAKGIKPARDADRRLWLRRVSFDLVGLPPTPQEMRAFLADETPDAYAKVVDRLLDSPGFGERWGRHWLDLVRYAETRGHEFDYTAPNAWQYRDYIVRALNADLPYDQFVTEQLAGDLLNPPRRNPVEGFNESIIGTGFWFLGEANHSPVDIRQDEADRFDNMIDVMSKTFLGLTVACARCHDHKFDAITTKDYYALAGFLQSSHYRLARFDTAEEHRHIAADLDALRARARKALLHDLAGALRGAVGAMDDGRLAQIEGALKVVGPATPSFGGAEVAVDFGRLDADGWMPDDVGFGLGPVRAGDPIYGEEGGRPIVGFAPRAAARYDRVWDRLQPAPGAENDPARLGSMVRAGRTLLTPTFTLKPGTVYYLVHGKGQAYASVDSHVTNNGPLHGELLLPIDAQDGYRWVAHRLAPYAGHRAHIEFTAAPGFDFAVSLIVQSDREPAPVVTAAESRMPFRERLGRVVEGLERGDLGARPELLALADAVVRRPELFGRQGGWWSESSAARSFGEEQSRLLTGIKASSRLAVAMLDGTSEDEHVFVRGSHKVLGSVVPRRFLEALAGPSGLAVSHGSGRLELARQMTDPKLDPFLPRVLVNRVWHHLFGRGLVGSVDNFGVLGERPTHPELLDDLALRFVEDGWSVKRLIRTLVLSRTYRMSSRGEPESELSDPQDLLLHRMRLRRLEGEAIRDAMLSLAGTLDARLYGPSVPVFLTPFMEGRGRPQSGPLDGDGRRSLYVAVRRNFLSPFLLAFDTPIPFSTVGKRTVSNVPAQALILMNDPFVHQQAERWAQRAGAQSGAPAERVAAMYESAFSRPPTPSETAACLEFVAQQARLSKAAPDALAPWTDLAHLLFNVKEFIFVQ